MITPGATSCSGACPTEAPDLGSIFICFDWELTEEHLASSSSCSLLTKLVTCYVNLAQYPSPCHPSPPHQYWIACKNISISRDHLFSHSQQEHSVRIIIRNIRKKRLCWTRQLSDYARSQNRRGSAREWAKYYEPREGSQRSFRLSRPQPLRPLDWKWNAEVWTQRVQPEEKRNQKVAIVFSWNIIFE